MSNTSDALTHAVDAENAAIFAYGVSTAFTTGKRRDTVAEFIAAHRVRRDALAGALRREKAEVPTPSAGYTLPVQVRDSATAVQALLAAEVDCTTAYRALLERAGDATIRRLGLEGLTECTVRAASWRVSLRSSPATVAFPGNR